MCVTSRLSGIKRTIRTTRSSKIDQFTLSTERNIDATIEVWEWISIFTPHYNNGCYHLSRLGSKLIWVNKRVLVMRICVSDLDQLWFRQWFGVKNSKSHHLNQCWPVVNWNPREIQWNYNNSEKRSHENLFENIIVNYRHFVQGLT